MLDVFFSLNSFYEFLKGQYIPSASRLIFCMLVIHNNRCGGTDWFFLENDDLMRLCGVKDTKAFVAARDKLIENNLIDYKKGRKGNPTKYKILGWNIPPNTPPEPPLQCPPNTPPEPPHIPDIDKDINKNTDNTPYPLKGGEQSSPQKSDNIPFADIMRHYNEICISFPKIKIIDGQRRKAVSARYKTYGSVDKFVELFNLMEASSFLKGNNGKNWRADFDWATKPTNMAKILEGKYNGLRGGDGNGNGNRDNKQDSGEGKAGKPKYGLYLE